MNTEQSDYSSRFIVFMPCPAMHRAHNCLAFPNLLWNTQSTEPLPGCDGAGSLRSDATGPCRDQSKSAAGISAPATPTESSCRPPHVFRCCSLHLSDRGSIKLTETKCVDRSRKCCKPCASHPHRLWPTLCCEHSPTHAPTEDWIPSVRAPTSFLDDALRAREDSADHHQVLAPRLAL